MAQFPESLQYTVEHEWVGGESLVTVGITDTAQDALGDIVYLELPAVGDEVTAGAVIGEIESTKSVSELFSPVTGTVVEVNQTAVDDPALVNSDPYGEGWLVKVDVTENDKGYVVHAEIPGVSKDDIQVSIEGNQVTIAAEVKRNAERKEGERVLRTERYYGQTYRSFTLPAELDEGQSEAKYENGVLTLSLAKKPAVAGRRLQVQ